MNGGDLGSDDRSNPKHHMRADPEMELKEIVMGLHWDPPEEGVGAVPENLDALCVLLDEKRRVLEIIHPGHPRNATGSVIHTGDSNTGASEWDDERIFVFLEALPQEVHALAFVVVSVTGCVFDEIRGAYCHVSDRVTEREWVRQELTGLRGQTAHCMATLYRSPGGWTIDQASQTAHRELLAELPSLAGKRAKP
jgi:stress response protein SCP2